MESSSLLEEWSLALRNCDSKGLRLIKEIWKKVRHSLLRKKWVVGARNLQASLKSKIDFLINVFRDYNDNLSTVAWHSPAGWQPLSLSNRKAGSHNVIFPVPETYKTEGIADKKSKSNICSTIDADSNRRLWRGRKNRCCSCGPWEMFTWWSVPAVRLIEGYSPSGSIPTVPDFAYVSDHEAADNYQLYISVQGKKRRLKKVSLSPARTNQLTRLRRTKLATLFYAKVDWLCETSKLCSNNLVAEKCYPAELENLECPRCRNKVILGKYWKPEQSIHTMFYDLQTAHI